MTHLADLTRSGDCVYDLPMTHRQDMRVPARVFADDELIGPMLEGDAMTQLVNVATLPGIVGHAIGMPDMHEGYGFPVGGVAAMRESDGVVSPGGVGFDINCGVRLLATPLVARELGKSLERFVHEISRSIPSGTGYGGSWRLADEELDAVLTQGSRYLVAGRGMGLPDDLTHTESQGAIPGADAHALSDRARERGRGQLGTIGSGNHFVEVQRVDEVFDPRAADAFGLHRGMVTILIHTGSRGLGHQVCTDFVKLLDTRMADYGITLPDRQLSCAPIRSPEGAAYLAAMAAAANFAFANRQLISHRIREQMSRLFPGVDVAQVRLVYDVAHNLARMEDHAGERLCVHRKGATRALGPNHPELPAPYREVGQPVFIPGSMGTASHVMAGASSSESMAWSSACHGAGRRLSRHAAKHQVTGASLRKELEVKGIVVRCPSNQSLAEEAPEAYKDVERVVKVVEAAGLATRVARLVPIGVVKG